MPAILTSVTAHSAVVPWEDVETAIASNATKLLAKRPRLQMSLGLGPTATLSLIYEVTSSKLDEILRASLPELPTLGEYTVEVISGDSTNALNISWQE